MPTTLCERRILELGPMLETPDARDSCRMAPAFAGLRHPHAWRALPAVWAPAVWAPCGVGEFTDHLHQNEATGFPHRDGWKWHCHVWRRCRLRQHDSLCYSVGRAFGRPASYRLGGRGSHPLGLCSTELAMFPRALAALLTVLLLATTSVAGSISYLCRMHDGAHQQKCCCKAAEAERIGEGARFEQTSRCCEVQLSDGAQAPAAVRGAAQGDLDLPVAVLAAAPVDILHVKSRVLALPVRARAPPSRAGPALFVLNCSYLI